MASHFLFHSEASETVPMNARFAFPTQASRVVKSQVKIPPRSGVTMSGLGPSAKGRLIQITLPAQGYLNPLESYLRFDLSWSVPSTVTTGTTGPRPINCIHSMFRRVRILYGSLVLEDIQNYQTLMRMLCNIAVSPNYQNKAGAILEGMGSDAVRGMLHVSPTSFVRQGDGGTGGTGGSMVDGAAGVAGKVKVLKDETVQVGATLNGTTTDITTIPTTISHTYCINLCSGLLTQQKLIPLKWLANQLTIEIEVDEPAGFTLMHPSLIAQAPVTSANYIVGYSSELVPGTYYPLLTTTGNMSGSKYTGITYTLDNIYFVAELLEFDSTYDAAFYQGMLTGGVPLKFASWHGFQHALQANSKQTLVIQERSRSIKSAFTVVRENSDLNNQTYICDPLWFYYGSSADAMSGGVGTGTDTSYGLLTTGTTTAPTTTLDEFQWRIGGRYFPSQPVNCKYGGAEPLIELQKALNSIGDYTISNGINPQNWFRNRGMFTIAGEFEATNGEEMSGVNAEELADLALNLSYTGSPASTQSAYTFVHYDAMIIIRPNNVMELVM